MGAPFAVCAQLATEAEAQPGVLDADSDKKDVNALLKLASRARFCESAGNKIKGFVADLKHVRAHGAPLGVLSHCLARHGRG